MSSEKSKEYWRKLANNIEDPRETTNKRASSSALVDVAFIKKHLKKDFEILDIGSGSGLVINELHEYVKQITAVETFKGLTKFIHPNIFVINAELKGFSIRKKYDAIISTGVTHYFTKNDIKDIYSNIYEMLKKNSKLILRSHCGLNKKVVINGFSEELQSDYFTEYRHIDEEIKLLKKIGFKKVELFDEVSEDLNVWENTRHFYFVCSK